LGLDQCRLINDDYLEML